MNIDQTKNFPSAGNYDVVVCGSGPAGISAAVSSARKGKSTLLIERFGMLGGCLTSSLVGPVMGRGGKGSLSDEINDLLGGDPSIKLAFDAERAKLKLTEMVEDAGVEIFLQTPVVDVVMDGQALKGVVIGTLEGLHVVHGKVVVDATGDGTVSFLAGADFVKGRESDGMMQPVSLMFRLYGVNEEIAMQPGNWTFDVRMPNTPSANWFLEFCIEASEKGELPKAVSLVRLYRTSRPGECHVNATHINYVDGTKVKEIGQAEFKLRRQIPVIVDFLKQHVAGFEDCFLQNSASTLGVRDTRRITGEYVLNREDLENARRFADVVVHNAWFFMDIHNITSGGQVLTNVPPYDIPWRCLVPLKIENLITSGRCISGTHEAEASYRIMSICMSTGQVAGLAAALCVEQGKAPRELDYRDVQKELLDLGVVLFSK